MPSRRSPSQRTPEGRQGRQMAALSAGTNGGRTISASGHPDLAMTAADEAGGGDSTHPGTGANSLQIGPSAAASGDSSVALGNTAAASGISSISVLGAATGNNSIALKGEASGSPSISIGVSSRAGTQSVAVGYFARAGDFNIAIGQNAGPATADAAYTGGGAVMIGSGARCRGNTGVAVGYSSQTIGAEAIAFGRSAQATGARSIAIGKFTHADDDDTAKIGADTLEVEARSVTESALILTDSAGGRWKITVSTGGALTTTAL